MNSATRLKALRERFKLSQNDVAKILKVSPALISSYERGERMPSPQKLSSLADLYHTTTDYLELREHVNQVTGDEIGNREITIDTKGKFPTEL